MVVDMDKKPTMDIPPDFKWTFDSVSPFIQVLECLSQFHEVTPVLRFTTEGTSCDVYDQGCTVYMRLRWNKSAFRDLVVSRTFTVECDPNAVLRVLKLCNVKQDKLTITKADAPDCLAFRFWQSDKVRKDSEFVLNMTARPSGGNRRPPPPEEDQVSHLLSPDKDSTPCVTMLQSVWESMLSEVVEFTPGCQITFARRAIHIQGDGHDVIHRVLCSIEEEVDRRKETMADMVAAQKKLTEEDTACLQEMITTLQKAGVKVPDASKYYDQIDLKEIMEDFKVKETAVEEANRAAIEARKAETAAVEANKAAIEARKAETGAVEANKAAIEARQAETAEAEAKKEGEKEEEKEEKKKEEKEEEKKEEQEGEKEEERKEEQEEEKEEEKKEEVKEEEKKEEVKEEKKEENEEEEEKKEEVKEEKKEEKDVEMEDKEEEVKVEKKEEVKDEKMEEVKEEVKEEKKEEKEEEKVGSRKRKLEEKKGPAAKAVMVDEKEFKKELATFREKIISMCEPMRTKYLYEKRRKGITGQNNAAVEGGMDEHAYLKLKIERCEPPHTSFYSTAVLKKCKGSVRFMSEKVDVMRGPQAPLVIRQHFSDSKDGYIEYHVAHRMDADMIMDAQALAKQKPEGEAMA